MAAPHATNTNSPEMLKAAFELAEKYGVLYTLHASEMDYEMSHFRENYGQTPIAFLHDLGVLSERTIAAHCIHMTDDDIRLLAKTGAKAAQGDLSGIGHEKGRGGGWPWNGRAFFRQYTGSIYPV